MLRSQTAKSGISTRHFIGILVSLKRPHLHFAALSMQIVRPMGDQVVSDPTQDANEKYFSLTIGNAPWPTIDPQLREELMEQLQMVKR